MKNIIFLLLFLLVSSSIFAQTNKTDSLEQLLPNMPDDTIKVQVLFDIAKPYMKNDSTKAFSYIDQSIKLSEKIKDYKYLAIAYRFKGIVYYLNSEYIKAYIWYLDGIEVSEKYGIVLQSAKTTRNIGTIFHRLRYTEKALIYFEKSLEMREQIGDSIGVASLLGVIGVSYFQLDSLSKATECYNKAFYLYKKLKLTKRENDVCSWTGNIYMKNQQYDSAFHYYNKCLNYSIILNDSIDQSSVYRKLGDIQLELEQYDSAFVYFQRSLKIIDKTNKHILRASILKSLGVYYYKINKPEVAQTYLIRSLSISDSIGKTNLSMELYEFLAEIYANNNKNDSAYYYKALQMQYSDSLHKKEIKRKDINSEFVKELEQLQTARLHKAELQHQKTFRNYLTVGFVLMIIIVFTVLRSFLQKRKANRILFVQKTQIENTNEELNQTNEELSTMLEIVNNQKIKIQKAHLHITDSINYAYRIQEAVLPLNILDKVFPNHFILFKPRDIVSGDFYWMKDFGQHVVVAAADCTGHGVPGAFMSMLGTAFLNEIVTRRNAKMPGQILNELRDKVKTSLKQNGADNKSQDGMDIAIYDINRETNTLHFAGANNPVFIIRNKKEKEIEELGGFNSKKLKINENDTQILYDIKGNHQPVSIYIKEKPFETISIPLQSGDCLYTFSDGYIDQFGGSKGQKFMTKAFKQLLLEISDKPMSEQKDILNETIINWAGKEYEQVDDILVVGVVI